MRLAPSVSQMRRDGRTVSKSEGYTQGCEMNIIGIQIDIAQHRYLTPQKENRRGKTYNKERGIILNSGALTLTLGFYLYLDLVQELLVTYITVQVGLEFLFSPEGFQAAPIHCWFKLQNFAREIIKFVPGESKEIVWIIYCLNLGVMSIV